MLSKWSLLRFVTVESMWATAGLAVGIVATQIVQDAPIGTTVSQALFDRAPIASQAFAAVNRVRKTERLDFSDVTARFTALYAVSVVQPDSNEAVESMTPFGVGAPAAVTFVPKVRPTEKDRLPAATRSGRDRQPKRMPTPSRERVDCEPVASPYVDPMLARLSGRCLASLTTGTLAFLN